MASPQPYKKPNKKTCAVQRPLDFRLLFESAPTPFLVVLPDDPVFTVVAASDASVHATGLARENLLGRGVFEAFPDTPRDPTASGVRNLRASFRRVIATRSPDCVRFQRYPFAPSSEGCGFEQHYWRGLNTPALGPDGSLLYIIHSTEKVMDEEAAAFIVDPTESKQSQRDSFLVRLDDATRPLANPDEIMETVSRLLGEHLQVDRCAYCTVGPDEDTVEIASEYSRPDVPSFTGRYRLTQFGEEAARLLRDNRPFVVEDIESDSRTAGARPAYRRVGIRATASVSLHKTGRLVAALVVHQRQAPRRWLQEEVELLGLVANRCWESIERARVTRELQESERRFRLSQKAGRIGSFEWLMKENRIIWTAEHLALYGISAGPFEGRVEDWEGRVVAEDAQRVLAEIKSCLARGGAELAYEFRAVLPHGRLRWLRAQVQFFYDHTGAPDRMLGVNIDIDAQKQAEAHLRQQWHVFDTALSNTLDFLYIFDLEGRFIYANRTLLSRMQMTLEQVLGNSFFDLDFPAALAGCVHRQIEQVIADRQPVRGQTSYTNPTGQTRHYECIFVPVFGAGGQMEAIAGSTRDVTERKMAEEQERERQERMLESARLESLGVMAGGIAHDFNNLLTGILGNASLLAETAHGAEHSMVNQIMLAAERAADLTRQMLAFSGMGRFTVERLDINTLVQENLKFLKASLPRTVSVELELCCKGCFIEADRGQIEQVVMNLLINASEAVGDRPGKVAIRTALIERESSRFNAHLQAVVPPGHYSLLEVRDNGSGMTAETVKKIFDPFFTTKFTGRGLGLAAVLGIVRGHHGDLEVVTQPGLGTTFRIFLPASKRVVSRGRRSSRARR
ncbi:MAG: domain S-box protein [Bryobacterales bacterium]|nr:domain S-box protein [Bryobacterales bacterium]